MANRVDFEVRLSGNGAEGLREVSRAAGDARDGLAGVAAEAEGLNAGALNFAAVSAGIDAIQSSVSQLRDTMAGLSNAYAMQIEPETKLATIMRNTMNARQETIQSIKDLCSAQQELGVIGDEVQLSGAQELATYLTKSESLKKLIPVMNDMLAQQYGLNATQESAANIATMLGKVMDGQVNALSRYGYKFDEAQEQILKYGTESQRVATLCDVVSASVGGMNAELAATDIGKQKQLENTLGDIKERLGGLTQGVMPFVTIAADATIAASGVAKLALALKGLSAMSLVAVTNLKTMSVNLGRSAALFATQFVQAVTGGTKAIKLFVTAWRGMLISTGIGIAILAVTAAIAYFVSKADEATTATNELIDAEKRAKREAEELEQAHQAEASTLKSARASLEIHISKLKNFNGTKEEEKKIVKELNSAYGSSMGYFSSVAGWYEALTSNSEAYCKQMMLEARTRRYADRIAALEEDRHNITYDEQGNQRKYSTRRDTRSVGTMIQTSIGQQWVETGKEEIVGSSDAEKAQQTINDINKGISHYKDLLANGITELSTIDFKVKGSNVNPEGGSSETKKEPKWTVDPQTIQEYSDNITILDKKIETATGTQLESLNKQKAGFVEARKALQELGVEVKKTDPIYDENATTLQQIGDNLTVLKKRLEEAATTEKAAQINADIELWEKKADAIRNAGKSIEDNNPKYRANAQSLNEINENISALNKELNETLSIDVAAKLNEEIKLWEKKADAIRNAGEQMKEHSSRCGTFNDCLGSVSGMLGSIAEMTKEGTAAWLQWGAKVLDACSKALPAIMAVTCAKAAESAAETPIVGWIMAGAAIASVIAAFAGIPKFADGGIAYGPTLGLFGEYAGASNNPEVVAPLSKLRGLLGDACGVGGVGGRVVFELDGRKLKGVLRNVDRFDERTR